MKKLLKAFLIFCLTLLLAPYGAFANEELDLENATYEEIIEAAKGQQVNFYGWGGDDKLNDWLDNVYAPHLKENFDITLNRVPMDIDQILNQLNSEKQAAVTESDVDMIWINGENFQTAKDNDLLYGPFVQLLPNYESLLDAEDPANLFDFAYPIDGMEAPYGKAQMVLIKNDDLAPEALNSVEDLMELAKAHPGQVTYAALPDFGGSAFVRTIIYQFVDWEVFQDMPADKEVVKEAIEPALEFLRELNPYLWNEGQSFPASGPEIENMYMDEELVLYMTYSSFDAAIGLADGRYPAGSQTYVFDKGTVGNTNFIAIGKNAKHKPAALVAINEMLSVPMQLSRYEELMILPVISFDKLDEEEKTAFSEVNLGDGIIKQDELLEKQLPEMPAELVPIIEDIWLEEVVGK